jgi:hypothetical protein
MRIHGLLDEARRVPTFQRIVFTGGEAFLLGADLDALIAHAHALGFMTRAVTNGYWAVNERGAAARVTALAEAGLDEVIFSTGTFHQAFVPVERVVHGARAAACAGIGTRISIEDCDQSRFDDAWLRSELNDAIQDGMIAVAHDPWIVDAGGRGTAPVTHERLRGASGPDVQGGCMTVMTTVSVTPDQELIACCGFPLEELPGLRIGSIAGRSLGDVLRDAPNDALKMFLHVAGPAGIAEFVGRYEPGYTLPGDPISICAACIALQRDPRAMRVAAQHFAAIADSVTARFIALQQSFELPKPPAPRTQYRGE